MKKIIFFLLLGISSAIYSQSDSLVTKTTQSGTVKEIYSVIFNTEIKQGSYEMYYNKILLCKGFYYNNQKHGPWTKYYPNGEVSTQGVYLKGKKNGLWKFVYQNKQLASVSQFKSGKETGTWYGFYMNGDTSCVMEYFQNNPDSIVKKITMYYQKKLGKQNKPSIKHREIISKEFYGEKINEINLYYDNGNLYKHCFYFNDTIDGLYNSYHYDGKPWEELSYDKAKLMAVSYIKSPHGNLMSNNFTNGTGTVNYYNCDGALESKVNYKNGVLDGDAIYYYYGALTDNPKRAEGQFAEGQKIGEWKYYEERNFNKVRKTVTYNKDYTATSIKDIGGNNKLHAELLFDEYHGKVKHYNSYKELINEYTYRNGTLHGPYVSNRGVLTEKGKFYFGSKTGKIGFYRGEKLRESEIITNNITVDSSYYKNDSLVEDISFRTSKYKHDSHYLTSSFYGGLAEESTFMAVYLNYPDSAKKNNVDGIVKVEITINSLGEVTTKLVKRIGYGCDEEVLRVLNQMPLFEPALYRGIPVQSKLIRIIYFPVPEDKSKLYKSYYRYFYKLYSRQWVNTLIYD